jgi:hypothetical protein
MIWHFTCVLSQACIGVIALSYNRKAKVTVEEGQWRGHQRENKNRTDGAGTDGNFTNGAGTDGNFTTERQF